VPCSCCAGEALDIFGEKGARRELRRYLEHGLGGADAKLIATWAEETGLAGATVLEIGGGIGQIQAELVRRGAARGTVVEVVAGYAGSASELAAAAGIADRSSFVLADLLEDPSAVEPADVVVLRRVVCCSPKGPELLGAAAAKARRTVLASYPRHGALTRAFSRLQNALFRLIGKRFRLYVYPPADLERAVAHMGLARSRVSRGLVWETARYDRGA
jgi:magnesium-protoporphyrin O-methyltransferase